MDSKDFGSLPLYRLEEGLLAGVENGLISMHRHNEAVLKVSCEAMPGFEISIIPLADNCFHLKIVKTDE